MARSKQAHPHRLLAISIYLLALAGIGYFFINGFDFYRTPLAERPAHELYQILQPGGFRSHGFGIVGALMLILLLGYSLRKHVHFMRKLGILRRWLNAHIFFGIIGPLLITLHTTFILHGLESAIYWLLIASTISGFIVWDFYRQIPRTATNKTLTQEEAKALLEELEKRLQNQFRIHVNDPEKIPSFINTNTESSKPLPARKAFAPGLIRFLRFRRIKKELRTKFDIPGTQIRPLMALIKQQFKLNRRVRLWERLHKIFRFWHTVHIVLAVVMYVFATIHIVQAVQSGYTWIF